MLFVCYEKTACWTHPQSGKSSGATDATIVATHMMLEAVSLELGSVWISYFDEEKARELLCLPESWQPVCMLYMGYPAKDFMPNTRLGYHRKPLKETCENQRRADERIPILKELPFKHKGIMCASFIGAVSIEKYLGDNVIEQVICGGENYDGARPCNFDWVKSLRAECVAHNITFCFIETGTIFIKDGKRYYLPKKQLQSEMAYMSGMNYEGKSIEWKLTDCCGRMIPKGDLYIPHYRSNCEHCGIKLIYNGCSDCGKCK